MRDAERDVEEDAVMSETGLVLRDFVDTKPYDALQYRPLHYRRRGRTWGNIRDSIESKMEVLEDLSTLLGRSIEIYAEITVDQIVKQMRRDGLKRSRDARKRKPSRRRREG